MQIPPIISLASIAEAASRSIRPCPTCGPLRIPSPFSGPEEGLTIPVLCPHQVRALEVQRDEEERRQRYAHRVSAYGRYRIPKPKAIGLEKVDGRPGSAAGQAAAAAFLRGAAERLKAGDGLYLCGPTGTGKSHVAGALAYELERSHYWTIFTSVSEFLDRCLGDLKDAGVWLQACKRADLLVLDDLGAEKPTEFALSKIFDIVNERHEFARSTVVTSNFTPAELANRYRKALEKAGDGSDVAPQRVLSRLLSRCPVVKHTGPDQRLAGRVNWLESGL